MTDHLDPIEIVDAIEALRRVLAETADQLQKQHDDAIALRQRFAPEFTEETVYDRLKQHAIRELTCAHDGIENAIEGLAASILIAHAPGSPTPPHIDREAILARLEDRAPILARLLVKRT